MPGGGCQEKQGRPARQWYRAVVQRPAAPGEHQGEFVTVIFITTAMVPNVLLKVKATKNHNSLGKVPSKSRSIRAWPMKTESQNLRDRETSRWPHPGLV